MDPTIDQLRTFYRVVRLDNQPVNPVKIEVIQGDFIDREKRFESGFLLLFPLGYLKGFSICRLFF